VANAERFPLVRLPCAGTSVHPHDLLVSGASSGFRSGGNQGGLDVQPRCRPGHILSLIGPNGAGRLPRSHDRRVSTGPDAGSISTSERSSFPARHLRTAGARGHLTQRTRLPQLVADIAVLDNV